MTVDEKLAQIESIIRRLRAGGGVDQIELRPEDRNVIIAALDIVAGICDVLKKYQGPLR